MPVYVVGDSMSGTSNYDSENGHGVGLSFEDIRPIPTPPYGGWPTQAPSTRYMQSNRKECSKPADILQDTNARVTPAKNRTGVPAIDSILSAPA